MVIALKVRIIVLVVVKVGTKFRDSPNAKGQDKKSKQASSSNVDASKKNIFYALRSRGEQQSSPNVVTGMLQVFWIDVYALDDPGDTLSFVTPLIARKFNIFPDILNEPFIVTTSVGESVVANRVYRNCHIMFPNRDIHVELVGLDMVDFDVILRMDWLHDCFRSLIVGLEFSSSIFEMNPS